MQRTSQICYQVYTLHASTRRSEQNISVFGVSGAWGFAMDPGQCISIICDVSGFGSKAGHCTTLANTVFFGFASCCPPRLATRQAAGNFDVLQLMGTLAKAFRLRLLPAKC